MKTLACLVPPRTVVSAAGRRGGGAAADGGLVTRRRRVPLPRLGDALRRASIAALVASSLACATKHPPAPQGALSETPRPPEYTWPRLSLAVAGQLFYGVDTDMRVDSPTLGEGTHFDLEDDLDVDDETFAGRIEATWRFGRRHALEAGVFELQREGSRVIDEQIQIGNSTFQVDTEVESEFDTQIASLAYRFSIFQRERWHAGMSLGAYLFSLRSEWTAAGSGLEEEFRADAPLPILGLFGSWGLTPKLYLSGYSDFFLFEYEDYDGFLNDTRIQLEHRTFEHLALGIGLDRFAFDASAESERDDLLELEFDYQYLGFMIFARLY